MPAHANKYRQIAASIRQRIVASEWPPGFRLPTKLQLCRDYGASNVTLQRVLKLLSAEGFLVSRGCAGTCVRSDPSHLTRIGVVYGEVSPRHSIYLDTFQAETRRQTTAGKVTFVDYPNCVGPAGSLTISKLRVDAAERRLAGVLFPLPVHPLRSHPLARNGWPVCVTVGDAPWYPDAWHLHMNPVSTRAFDFLRDQRRRRLAIVCTPMQHTQCNHIWQEAAEHGLETARHWTFSCDPHHPTLEPVLELLGRLPPATRPDAVYIMDDHLVMCATRGLAASGVGIGPGAPLLVVAHSNFPSLPPAACPVVHIGYDVAGIVATSVAIVAARVAGMDAPRRQDINPVIDPRDWN